MCGVCCDLLLPLLLQVADRGGLPAVAAAAAAGAAGPVPEGAAEGAQAMGEDLGEFWYRTGEATAAALCVDGPMGEVYTSR